MIRPLTPERFATLADAYGGSIDRWPAEVQAEAHALATEPKLAAILRAAMLLDERLDAWEVTPPEAALYNQIVRRAPVRIGRRLRLWWAGLGIAAALAGAGAGSFAAAALPSDHVMGDEGTAFGSLAMGER